MHTGVLLAVGPDHLGQWQCRIADGGVQHAEIEGAAQLALERRRVALEPFQFPEQAQGLLMEQLALAGQAETTTPTMTEHDAQLTFQLTHVSADGRRGQIQLLLRGSEALVTDHGDEDLQQFQVGQGEGHGRLRQSVGGQCSVLRRPDTSAMTAH